MKRIALVLVLASGVGACKETAPVTQGGVNREAEFVKMLLASSDHEDVCAKLESFVQTLSRGEARGHSDRGFSNFEAPAVVPDKHYFVDFGGVGVAVFDREYDLEFKPNKTHPGVSFTLRAPGQTVRFEARPDRPLNDYFEPPNAQPGAPTAETLAIFGKAPRTSELVREAFEKQLADFRCDAANKNAAIKMAMLMNMKKSIFGATPFFVHKDVGVEGSLLWLVQSPRGYIVKHEFAVGDELLSVSYAVQSEKLYASSLRALPARASKEPIAKEAAAPAQIALGARIAAGDGSAVPELLKVEGLRLTTESKAALKQAKP